MVSLLFSFRGRISRKQYWVGMALVGFASAVGRMLTTFLSVGSFADAKEPSDMLAAALGASAAALPLYGVILWWSLAIQFKRFHDRGRTGWLSMAPIVLTLMLIASIVGDVVGKAPLERLFNDALPYFVVLMVISLAFFIDLGCLEGVEGSNKYGPPPGAPSPIEPSRPSGAVEATSSLFGAQSAMDRAIAERQAQPRPVQRASAPATAAAPTLATALRPSPVQAAPAGFGRRAAR
jgi:uncharacterized membrane protein YhaH (DUF805 family)